MITLQNYVSKKSEIDWSKLPKNIADARNDIDDIMEFYHDDKDVKEAVDLFLKGINDNLPKEKPTPEAKKTKATTKKAMQPEQEETLQETVLKASLFRSLCPKMQQMAVLENDESEEVQFFINKVKELNGYFEKASKRQNTDSIKQAIVYAHYFYGKSHWYITEYDYDNDEFFGYVILNGDTQMSEAGYISVPELLSIKGMELDFYFEPKTLQKVLQKAYPNDFEKEKPQTNNKQTTNKSQTKGPAKEKVKNVVNLKIVETQSNEFVLIRRFWNMIEKENVVVPFRKVQLLYQAFNKASVERKVRKVSEDAVLFEKVKAKIVLLFEKYAEPDKANVEIEFTDKILYKEIKEYADAKLNPAIAILKRFIGLQGTRPDVKKAETLLKSISTTIEKHGKGNRLLSELQNAQKELQAYISKPSEKIQVTVYGLSVPRNECTNRIKCSGITHEGKLRKGYKFQEGTGHIIRVKKKKINRNPKKQVVGLGFSVNDQEESYQTEVIYYNEPQRYIPPVPVNNVSNTEMVQNSVETPRMDFEKPINRMEIVNNVKKNNNPLVKSMAERGTTNADFEFYNISGQLADFLGNIEIKPKDSVAITLDAPQGAGKTRLLFQMQDMFADSNYRGLFISLEEHPDSALFINKQDEYIKKSNQHKIDTVGELPNGYSDLLKIIPDYDVIFIDSWGKLAEMEKNLDFDKDLRKKFDGKLFVVIFQRTQDGKMRGGSAAQFDGDIIMKIRKDSSGNYKNNIAYYDKHRYHTIPLNELEYNIYSKKMKGIELETVTI